MTENEFSRPVDIETLNATESVHDIVATESECAALAARFDLRAVDALAATVRLRRDPDRPAIYLEGRIVADVTQECVVTLAPVRTHIDEVFATRFEAGALTGGAEEEVRVEDDEVDLEPLPDDWIDIGEIVAEQLALAVPAHPRAAGARFEMPDGDREPPATAVPDTGDAELAPGRARPFAGLDKRMKSQ